MVGDICELLCFGNKVLEVVLTIKENFVIKC